MIGSIKRVTPSKQFAPISLLVFVLPHETKLYVVELMALMFQVFYIFLYTILLSQITNNKRFSLRQDEMVYPAAVKNIWKIQ